MNFSNIIAAIQFPKSSGLGALILGLLKSIYNLVGNYGVAVILFTLVLRLIMLPLDFGNRYFTKKNTNRMAELKPEEDKLKAIYANDPLSLNRARQELYKKHGYSTGGFCLFTLLNLVVTLFVFITVLNSLNSMSTLNLNRQYIELQAVYQDYENGNIYDDITGEDFKNAINAAYKEHNVSFLWVNNLFRPDTAASKILSFSEYKTAVKNVDLGTDFEDYIANNKDQLVTDYTDRFQNDNNKKNAEWWYADETRIENQFKEDYLKKQYDTILENLNSNYKNGWNGLFLLVVLAGVTAYLSSLVNSSITKKQKKTSEKNKTEQVIQYSIRDTKGTAAAEVVPQIDPAMMGNMMKFLMPMIMVIVTLSYTSAFAVYIITSSLLQTAFTFGSSAVVDKILEKQSKKQKKDSGPVINPHARYFKNK